MYTERKKKISRSNYEKEISESGRAAEEMREGRRERG